MLVGLFYSVGGSTWDPHQLQLIPDKMLDFASSHRLQHFLRNNFYQHPVELEHVTEYRCFRRVSWV